MSNQPAFLAPARFDDPTAALQRVTEIYNNSVNHLRGALQAFVGGDDAAQHV
ncbi:MAG: hypothetical protein RJA98_3085, partial [Pseudomonadota bacterium]